VTFPILKPENKGSLFQRSLHLLCHPGKESLRLIFHVDNYDNVVYDMHIIISFIFRDMNFSTRNICIALLAVVLGVYLLTPKADADEHCIDSMCLHCNGMIFSANESAAKSGLDDHICDGSFGNSPCSVDKNSNPDTPVVIVPATNPDPQKTSTLLSFVSYNPFLFQNVRVNDKADQFRFASETIPLYLQNVSFLC
jgi:hypothetical protein